RLGAADIPPGETEHDEYFGDVEIHRGSFEVALPLDTPPDIAAVELQVTLQGCADRGLCYPPQKRLVRVDLPSAAAAATPGALDKLTAALRGLAPAKGAEELLPPDEAFVFGAEVKDARTLSVSWRIADGYYLYRDKFRFILPDAAGVRLGDIRLPKGAPHHDEEFGDVEVYRGEVVFELPLLRDTPQAQPLRLTAHFQGCAERGVCYPPMDKTVALALPALDAAANPPAKAAPRSEQERIAGGFRQDGIGLTLLSFLGFGLLLAFTPCTFPMIPILSGIIAGHGHALSPWRGFALSFVFVFASALTYTAFGILAALSGANLQALLQIPAVIYASAALFVALALSMFGFYQLQLPAGLQNRLDRLNRRQKSGTYIGAAIMGVLSTLVVGPCVAAPLAGALLYIGQTGDAVIGGLALFSLGFGSGIPLLVIGASAGKLLPRAGHWMNAVKSVFGVLLLAVAVWLLARVVPLAVSMTLWALLLIIPAIYLGALDTLPAEAGGWRRLWKGVGLILFTYGVLLLIGVAAGSKDPLQPLRGLAVANARTEAEGLVFRRVRSVGELDAALSEAQAQRRPVMLDFYADWCVSCKELERDTFADTAVRAAVSDAVLLQADVTANSDEDQSLLRRFGLIGPPAVLFFGTDAVERDAYRVIGYMNAPSFRQHAQEALQCVPERTSC
ncbi:MAG TPA: protein-disulfide reductase DsbD, partial [Methylococcaceae bacterium]|nr:protein-disulfide reductase DsbD [Methylococcaceae bacterium]